MKFSIPVKLMSNASDEEVRPTPEASPPPLKHVSHEAANTYLERRLKPQLAWYDSRAQVAKRWNVTLITIQLVMTSSIPIANALLSTSTASTVLAAAAALATGYLQMGKFHDDWVRYRTTAAALDAIKLRYELKLSPFEGTSRHARLIEEAEKAIAQEGMQWSLDTSAKVKEKTTKVST